MDFPFGLKPNLIRRGAISTPSGFSKNETPAIPPVEEIVSEDKWEETETEEDACEESIDIDENIEIYFKDAVKAWLQEFGAQQFQLAANQFLVKQQKKKAKPPQKKIKLDK